ncbi:hypothetical protein IWX47DRAFT_574883 [Phyllosticta citricarpa]
MFRHWLRCGAVMKIMLLSFLCSCRWSRQPIVLCWLLHHWPAGRLCAWNKHEINCLTFFCRALACLMSSHACRCTESCHSCEYPDNRSLLRLACPWPLGPRCLSTVYLSYLPLLHRLRRPLFHQIKINSRIAALLRVVS